MSEYLLEVRFQEMPRQHVFKLTKRLTTRLFEDLMGRGLGPATVTTGMTPRRMMVCFAGLPEVSADREQREIGPALEVAYDDGEPTEALLRFADRVGAALEDLREIKTERGAYVGFVRHIPGLPLEEVLSTLVPNVLAELDWWPAVRAGGGIRGFLSLLEGEVLGFEALDTVAGATTAGHPVLSPETFPVTDFEDYLRRLRELGIEVLPEARRQAIETAIGRITDELAVELEGGDELLEQLVGSCEIPGVLFGELDPEHLRLPEEIFLAALGSRLGCFALRGAEGLRPAFLTVMDRADDPAGRVRSGYERAVDGCLVDARFNYDADRRVTLAERLRLLEDLELHPRLGAYASKATRTRALVELVCQELGWDDVLEPAQEAASLLKTDLTTRVVQDFPSLRGTIGGIFAREEGYVDAICTAISQHYRMQPIPSDRAGQVVAVADRLDTLVGFSSIDRAPSGSRDPFGLRRLTQGLIRIVIDANLELDLDLMAARAVLLFGDSLARPDAGEEPASRGAEQVLRELQSFLADRTRHVLGQRGFAYDEIEAAEAVGSNNLPDLVARLTALQTVREEPEFRSLVLSAKRISNIVQDSPEFELEPRDLAPGAESDLAQVLGPVRDEVDAAAKEKRYEACLRAMVRMVPELEQFFADVLVMDENEALRHNRIALLQACRRVFWRIARLKEMAVEKPGGAGDVS
ncbi:MAG: glycine--tRNA ligase subunit beta [Acidobacteriota bacterium]